MSIIVSIVGGIAAGKTTAARFLEQIYGFRYLRYSLLLKTMLEARGIPPTDASLLAFGEEIHAKIGGAGLSALLMSDYDAKCNYVIDGMRHVSDYTYFVERFGPRFFLIYFDVPNDLRYTRFSSRHGGRDTSGEVFAERSTHDTEAEVPQLRDYASIILDNTGSLDDLKANMTSLVSDWLSQEFISGGRLIL